MLCINLFSIDLHISDTGLMSCTRLSKSAAEGDKEESNEPDYDEEDDDQLEEEQEEETGETCLTTNQVF
jgi:hypothetical protein